MNSAQESLSSITDSLNSLSTDQIRKSEINKHLKSEEEETKTFTVTDIVNKRINSIEDYLNTKVINIYQRPWNKLEPKLRSKKLDEYYENGPLEQATSDEEDSNSKKRKKGLEAYSNYSLTQIKHFLNTAEKKRVKVVYDESDCRINSIIVSN